MRKVKIYYVKELVRELPDDSEHVTTCNIHAMSTNKTETIMKFRELLRENAVVNFTEQFEKGCSLHYQLDFVEDKLYNCDNLTMDTMYRIDLCEKEILIP